MRNRQSDPWLLTDDELDPDLPPRREKPARMRPPRSQQEILAELSEPEETEEEVQFTYKASRHEAVWLASALKGFYADHLISDVLHLVRGGKEATVYCCKAHPTLGLDLLAAKVYRPRMFRSLKNDAIYREGRPVLDEHGKPMRDQRSQRAILKKTRLGTQMQITSWIEYEYRTMFTLFEAGVSVPRPVAQDGNTILMEYIGEAGHPAPTLNSVALSPEEARPLFDRLLVDIRTMLAHNCVHADLSAYNVLYWEGKVSIIDFPQVIDPLYNPRGLALLERDIERICQHFARYGIRENATWLANELWSDYLG